MLIMKQNTNNNSNTHLHLIETRKAFNGHYTNEFRSHGVVFGFTELNFLFEELGEMYLPYKPLMLKQVHSDIIFFTSEVAAGGEVEVEGDGLILDEPDKIAVIETADCTPMFFWYPGDKPVIGGVIHVGWRGLWQDIEKKTLLRLKEKIGEINLSDFHVFLGPAIEGDCYEVKEDVWENFKEKSYRDKILIPFQKDMKNTIDNSKNRDNHEKYWKLDVKKGVRYSLQEIGVPGENIGETSLCTFCEAGRFPSYRRAKGTGQRIHNYLFFLTPGMQFA